MFKEKIEVKNKFEKIKKSNNNNNTSEGN